VARPCGSERKVVVGSASGKRPAAKDSFHLSNPGPLINRSAGFASNRKVAAFVRELWDQLPSSAASLTCQSENAQARRAASEETSRLAFLSWPQYRAAPAVKTKATPMSFERLAKLDIDLLLALDALLEESNVTRAAKRLSIQQSALSARLTRLRGVFDDRLFIPSPSGRGVLPTPRALALQPILAQALASLKQMVEPADRFEPATSDRTFTIALFENPAATLDRDDFGWNHPKS
jgi:hypothetical protein